MKIGVLTSSRADFGIYIPLLKALKEDEFFQLQLIVFGTHLSKFHGYSVQQILDEGFEPKHQIHQMIMTDEPVSIATSYAMTAMKFAEFWQNNVFDCVFCLGDRYEMAAAVAAGIPFNVPFAHIHGGETTLGAIDNVYRHCITLAAKWHFVAAEPFKDRIKEITGTDSTCVVTGSLSLVNHQQTPLLSLDEFRNKWQIDLSIPSILITLHPETVAYQQNEFYASEAVNAFKQLSQEYQLIITMPNADTSGMIYRNAFLKLHKLYPEKVFLIENFGTQSYFSCMNHVRLVLGNSSSGIIEAASFNKYVLDLGDRQKGRLKGENVINIPFHRNRILDNVTKYAGLIFKGENLYFNGNAINLILSSLKRIL
jgi:GDP/UDP-N,N'-diacetylbacillosamine 2-epimerase (hydrolysing)